MIPAPMTLEHQLQHERTARAQTALRRGEMQVKVVNDAPQGGITWTVVSKGERYTVSLDGAAWTCTCPDFTGRCQRFGMRCKHIEAVPFSQLERPVDSGQENQDTQELFFTQHTEEHMTQSMPTPNSPPLNPAGEQILWRLRQPLDMSRVKRRQAPGMGTVPYLEGYSVIEIANDLFQFRWSFDLLSEPQITRWDRPVTFYDQRAKKKVPVLGEDGKPVTEIAGVVHITGRITVELDGKAYSHADVGRCTFTGDSPEALDMALAGAVTDCLKRCFRQMGEPFGNSLYDKEIAKTAGLAGKASPENNGGNGHGPNGNGKPEKTSTPAQPDDSSSSAETLKYRDGAAVDAGNPLEVEAFHAFRSIHLGLAPASREVLRAWKSSQNNKK